MTVWENQNHPVLSDICTKTLCRRATRGLEMFEGETSKNQTRSSRRTRVNVLPRYYRVIITFFFPPRKSFFSAGTPNRRRADRNRIGGANNLLENV